MSIKNPSQGAVLSKPSDELTAMPCQRVCMHFDA